VPTFLPTFQHAVVSPGLTPNLSPSLSPSLSPNMPAFIPIEVCTAVGMPLSTPIDQCMSAVKADVAEDGVAAPAADVAGLQQVVTDARDRGVDVKVVVMQESPVIDTPLRDIATAVGQDSPGSTVLVLSPGWAGTYSTTYDRVLLEAGQDVAKLADTPVQAAQNFVDQLKTPIFDWTAFTIFVVFAVAAAAAATGFLRRWARRTSATHAAPATAPRTPTQ
jgi:hypothetical protein